MPPINRPHGDTTRNWRLASLLLLGAFLGLGVTASVSGLLPGDLGVRQELLEGQTDRIVAVARVVNQGGTWHVLVPGTLLLLALSPAARRHWALWCVILVTSPLIEHAVKFLVGRPRPSGFSQGFPSGHTTAAATFGVIVVYLANREPLPPALRITVQVAALAMIALVGWARIVLHAHWPTDVLGGFLLGGGCAAAGAWWESARLDARRAGAAPRT